MKNFDIRFWIDLHSLTGFLQSLNNHTFAWLDAIVDDPVRTDGLTHFDGPDFYCVAVIDDGDLPRPLKINDCTLWNQKRPLLNSDRGADSCILSGPQAVSRVREEESQSDGTGLDVNLTIGK